MQCFILTVYCAVGIVVAIYFFVDFFSLAKLENLKLKIIQEKLQFASPPPFFFNFLISGVSMPIQENLNHPS